MRLILSTQNPSKALQIQTLLNIPELEVITLAELDIHDDVEENGTTLEENAAAKALFAYEKIGGYCIGEDTGLYIDTLDGRPGIHAKRWAGENTTTEEIRDFTLEQLRNVPFEKRTATFKTVAVLMTPDGSRHVFNGEKAGHILETPRMECQPAMPYSALVQPLGESRTWVEMSTEEENAISHRGIAIRALRDFLLKRI